MLPTFDIQTVLISVSSVTDKLSDIGTTKLSMEIVSYHLSDKLSLTGETRLLRHKIDVESRDHNTQVIIAT